ncbi:mechanosensitive ion channel [Kamptonema cortianum]|uniref:Mechanosensitive ion channel n=1 Tax=Geitlerinema calcuttense NRMC-F 0142 TaxID=2922238 RepID=A0ABT7M055_9CYAN|nr:mechanosensitive ion channel domain-containing protein [Geitlerinema calcuttense]MCD8487478.1 mechanosensitive ion channel family protein [Desertifilum sp.]MDI9640250.1 mechanosensitive ion channel [Geitlerinema splendidum]MDK3157418.1 mechanosensitive ion channel [Kamptonema cortianum]MDL5057015.1 mechanosensitive ion channel [Geitlerinema calcuttense NRMC-F 0142]
MIDFVPDMWMIELAIWIVFFASIGVFSFVAGSIIPWMIRLLIDRFVSQQAGETYGEVIQLYQGLTRFVFATAIAEVLIFLFFKGLRNSWVEIILSLSLAISASWLASRIFRQVFDVYLIDVAFKSGRKVNSELLLVGKYVTNFSILLLAVIYFAQTHKINIFGLIASLGVGGLAVAFAAQKTIEQFIGGIVLFLDRPFVVDDYIGLPDGTFGRVESIGLRSTKIRTSGKGTLMIIPNNSLTQTHIENFTGAKKVMSIVYLNFHQTIVSNERALIRQIILESTSDIFGLDSRNTDVTFRELGGRTQAQITFFILGSGEVSMDLRRQLLDVASQNITFKLKEYKIAFDIEEPTIYVDAPITI